MPDVFSITTPATSVQLEENRIGDVSFTVTNVSGRKLRARVRVVPTAGAPGEWFSVEGEAEQDFEAGAARQFTVRVEPPLGVAAGTYSFRLDAIGIERPDDDYAEGPTCAVTVPVSAPPHVTTPRGYVTTLVGAIAGGALGELVIVIMLLLRRHDAPDCHGIGCVIAGGIGEIILLVFALFAAYVLMLIGASVGSAVALRIRRYLGAKLTGGFLALLMVPWFLLITFAVFRFMPLVGVAIAAPLLLVAVPAVLARGSVLLIRTHHV